MLLRREATEERDEHIDMTPMVDVVFQLMTFMLFSVQMTGGEKVDVPPARHGVGVQESPGHVPDPAQAGGRGGRAAAPSGSRGRGQGHARQARKAVADGVRQDRRKVILQADGAVPHGEVLKVAAAVTEVEGVTVHVGVQELKGNP